MAAALTSRATLPLRRQSRAWVAILGALTLCLAGAKAETPDGEPAAPTRGSTPLEQTIDPALVELQRQLDALLAGTLSESILVPTLFAIRLDDLSAVTTRTRELATEIRESEAGISGMRDELANIQAQPGDAPRIETTDETAAPGDASPPEPSVPTASPPTLSPPTLSDSVPEPPPLVEPKREQRAAELQAQLDSATLRLDIATKRLRYLRSHEAQLKRMTDASRRVLPSLGSPRSALRAHAALLSELGASLEALAARLGVIAQRSESGMLVGFVSEQKALAADLSAAASSYRQQVRQLDALAAKLGELASAQEVEGLRVRANFFRAPGLSDGGAVLDELFLTHLKAQRRLRTTVSDVVTVPGQRAIDALRGTAQRIASAPLQVGTTSDAQQVLDAGVDHRQSIDALLAAESVSTQAWELAFENEVVAVCSELASTEARASAYRFSSELLTDVKSEVEIAWTRIVEGTEARRAEVPTLAALMTTPVGQGYLLRGLGMLAVAAAWLVLRRKTPRLTVLSVKLLARLRPLRGRAGLLVRWSGLWQAILPVLIAFAGLQGVLLLIGKEGPSAQFVRAVAVPILIYLLGRQVLLGATRRITRGRPALIELHPATLARLQQTYATLGIVVALAYIVDGVARAVIGGGRLVALLEGTVLFWIALWTLWAALQWRTIVAERWEGTLLAADPPTFERRLAQWMGRSRLGFLLSPVAAARIAGTPVANSVASIATGTDFAQSLRARLLRHRSKQSDVVAQSTGNGLPEEYLAAFPLYPILGEDDSLLVPREGVLTEVIDQWNRWNEARTDASLVVIGEKGAGKTTLAAQVARRLKDTNVVQHTVRGKPTTADAILGDISEALGFGKISDLDEVAQLLCEGPERVVFLDEAHNVFLRQVGGYTAYDGLVELVNSTSTKVFWVLLFNSFTWRFLNESRGRVHYFRKLLQLPKWTPEEIQRLIGLRNKKTGFEVRFDEVLLSDEKSTSGGIELVEEADGYFRLLWESSAGNPRIATRLWLSSLRQVSERSLAVGLFREPDTAVLSNLPDDLVFSLAAICQHENLSSDELARVLNVSEGFARFAVQFLSESGFLERKDPVGERHTLAPAYYRAVLRTLKSKHLVYE